jgi:hypothetical protein
MLRIMQKDVNQRIKKIDDEVTKSGAGDMSKDQKGRQRRAAAKEGDIARVTTKIANELEGKAVQQKQESNEENSPEPQPRP